MTKTCKTTSKLGKDENGREYGSKECLELNGWSNCVKKERAFNDGGFEFEMQNREQFQHFEGIGERKRRALGKSGTWFLQTLFAVLALTSLTGNAINPGENIKANINCHLLFQIHFLCIRKLYFAGFKGIAIWLWDLFSHGNALQRYVERKYLFLHWSK